MRSLPALLSAALATIAALSPAARASDPGGEGPALAKKPASARLAALSPDGRWVACTINSGAGPSRLQICDTGGQRRREVVGVGGLGEQSEPAFSGDSKCVIYSAVSPEGFVEYVVRDLETWTTKRSFRFASSFARTPDARYLVIKGPPGMTDSGASSRPPGAGEVVIYSPVEDRITVIGPASCHELSSDGQFVALAKAGPDGRTSLDVLRLGETKVRRVDEIRGEVSALAWGDDHRSLVLVIAQDNADGKTADLLVAIDDATAKTPRIRSILPENHATWPRGAFLDPTQLRVGDAAAVVYFVVTDEAVVGPRRHGLAAQDPRHDEVEIHRAIDEIMYSAAETLTQVTPAATSRVFAWIPEEGRIAKVAAADKASVVPLRLLAKAAAADQTSVVPLRGGRMVVVPSRSAGSPSSSDSSLVDFDIIDPVRGIRTSLGQRPVSDVSPSRTGRYVAYFGRGHWWAYDTKDGARRDLTAATGPSFDADLSIGPPVTGAEWLDDDRGLIAHDKYDAWLLRADGSARRRLTRGRERGRVYRLAATGTGDHAPGGPYYVHVFEIRSKYSGYLRVGADGAETVIGFGPWIVDRFAKARDVERFVFQRETYETPPSLFTADARGGDPCPINDFNLRDDTVPPPRRELIEYRDRRDAELQGTLIYPVEYNSAKKYPMVVSVYMVQSDDHFRYRRPQHILDSPLTYASRGYFVLLPDIVPRPRELGPSAVDCVESAVRAVLRRGLVDPGRIGLEGGSHGGYETAFVLSKSKLFAAGVAGSPVVDYANDSLLCRLGNVRTETFVLRSLGMTVPFWEDPESYVASSVIYQAHGITTPLLIGVGRQDRVVDYRSGESLFNLLRYLKRPAYLVAYPRGGHELTDDFKRRAGQFFDHYLKGEPPADWIAAHERR
jgi:dipeptidyl aminopeptidase/acylaminoacyl peptidase